MTASVETWKSYAQLLLRLSPRITHTLFASADGTCWWSSDPDNRSRIEYAVSLLLAEPASVDGGEITDKGYVNQRAVLTRRAGAVATLEDDACAEWIGCPG